MTIAIVNDGKMAWRATLNDYVDGSGTPLNALGALVMINLNEFEIGWINFNKGTIYSHERWLPASDPASADIADTKPPLSNVADAWRFALRSKQTGVRSLTASGSPMMTAINTLHDDWISRPEAAGGIHAPIVRLGSKDTSNTSAKSFFVPTLIIDSVALMPPQWQPSAVTSAPAAVASVAVSTPPALPPTGRRVEQTKTTLTVAEMHHAYDEDPRDILAVARAKLGTGD
jgi:hypothetical protein